MSEVYKGAAGAFYYVTEDKRVYVLVGKESQYVRDYIRIIEHNNNESHVMIHPETREPFTVDTIKAYETVLATDINSAHAMFARRARALTRLNHTTVHYDTPVITVDEQNATTYKVNYRMLHSTPIRYGLIKGNRENGERDSRDTLRRELLEEVGIELDRINSKFVTHAYDTAIFYVELSDEHKELFLNTIREKNKDSYGEMYALRFIELSVLESMHINAITNHSVIQLKKRFKY